MPKHIEVPDWGSWTDANPYGASSIDISAMVNTRTKKDGVFRHDPRNFDGMLSPVTVDIPAGTDGLISLVITLHYRIFNDASVKIFGLRALPNPFPDIDEKTVNYRLDWSWGCTAEGELNMGRPTRPTQIWKSAVAMTIDAWTWKDEDDKKDGSPFIKLQISLAYTQNPLTTVSLGYGPVSLSPASPAGGQSAVLDPLQINLNLVGVKKPAPLPPPAPPPAPGTTLSHTVYFNTGDYVVDRLVKEPDGKVKDQGKAIDDWINDEVLRNHQDWDMAIRKGYVTVYVVARASPPWKDAKTDQAKRENNRILSRNRLQAVMAVLKDRWPNAKFDPNSAGMSQTQLERLGPQEQSCTILISDADLQKGIALMKAAKTP